VTYRSAGRAALLLCIGVTGAAGRANAQELRQEAAQYVQDRWDGDRGFPGGAVHAIAQAADGHLWIGGEQGLVRFDGVRFERMGDASAFPAAPGRVVGLVAGPHGELFVRLPGPRILRYHDGTFEDAVPGIGSREDAFTTMAASADGEVLLAGLVSGILKRTPAGFTRLAPGAPSSSPVVAMEQAPDGTVWLGTREGELFRAASGRVTSVARGRPGQQTNCLEVMRNGDVWVGTSEGVVRWDGTSLTTAGVPAPLRQVEAVAMLQDSNEALWVGARTGLWRADASGATALGPASKPGEGVSVIFEDRERNLWTGSPKGIGRLRASSFASYGAAEGLPSDRSGPVYVDREERVWFAPLEGGLYCLRSEKLEKIRVAGLAEDVVYSIAEGGDGIWVGRQRGGLTHLRYSDGRLESRTLTHADGLAQDGIFSVHQSRDGTVWAGTLSRGVSRLRDGRVTTYTTHDGLASDTVASILEGPDGTTWFATPKGLSALSTAGWRTFTTREGLPSDEVDSLLVGAAGGLWIGTGDGLAHLASGRIKAVRLSVLSSSEQVRGLAEDAGGWLWFTTSRRIARVKDAQLDNASAGGAVVTEFGLGDGLRGIEGVKRHRSLVTDGRGRIWLSTDRGLAVADPARMRRAEPVAAHLVGVAADGNALGLGEPVQVPPGRRTVTFHFGGVSLSDPERLRFRYRLDGFDTDWSQPTLSREARYTNLAPGPYRFRARAFALGRSWSGPEAALRLHVEPGVFEKGWVRLTALLTVGLVLAGLYRLRVHRVTRRLHVLFEERLAERLRIANDLHDTLLQGLVSASMQLYAASERLPPDSPARPLLNRVQEVMGRVIGDGRAAVGILREAGADPGELGAAFARAWQEIATEGGPELRVGVGGEPRPLRPDTWEEAYRIGREALVNALRHAKARKVEIQIEYDPRGVRTLIRDDGVGIDPAVLRSGRPGHFGLAGMRERSERLGARFTVRSARNSGTEIEVWIRGAVAYRSTAGSGLLERIRRRLGRSGRPGGKGADPHRPAESFPSTEAGGEAR
jgi:signal transduction histidine kinase/ligand-binding sensor domain-containing protein